MRFTTAATTAFITQGLLLLTTRGVDSFEQTGVLATNTTTGSSSRKEEEEQELEREVLRSPRLRQVAKSPPSSLFQERINTSRRHQEEDEELKKKKSYQRGVNKKHQQQGREVTLGSECQPDVGVLSCGLGMYCAPVGGAAAAAGESSPRVHGSNARHHHQHQEDYYYHHCVPLVNNAEEDEPYASGYKKHLLVLGEEEEEDRSNDHRHLTMRCSHWTYIGLTCDQPDDGCYDDFECSGEVLESSTLYDETCVTTTVWRAVSLSDGVYTTETCRTVSSPFSYEFCSTYSYYYNNEGTRVTSSSCTVDPPDVLTCKELQQMLRDPYVCGVPSASPSATPSAAASVLPTSATTSNAPTIVTASGAPTVGVTTSTDTRSTTKRTRTPKTAKKATGRKKNNKARKTDAAAV